MKYLAILRDSLREALDAKVIYVLMALSALVVAFVASISFQPQPAEQGLQAIVNHFPRNLPMLGLGNVVDYRVEEFKQQNETSKPWAGQYDFHLVVKEEKKQAFPLLVLTSSLQKEEKDFNDQDREARKRLIRLLKESRDVPMAEREKYLNDHLAQELGKVSTDQKEAFVKNQLAGQGSLETTRVQEIKGGQENEIPFEVQVRGKEGADRTWPGTLTYFFGALPTQSETALGSLVFMIESSIVGSFGAGITMLISTIITAFFIPGMLRKGTIDLLLAKPIHRWVLLIYKFIGGLAFMFLNTVVIVVGIWLVLGLRSGLWAPGFLLAIFILTFEFAIFYAVSTLFGVLTQSPIVAILTACFTWAVLFVVGWAFLLVDATRELNPFPDWVHVTTDSAHFVLPRYKDLDALTSSLIGQGLLSPDSFEYKALDKTFESIHWGETLGFSSCFIVLMLGLACWRFSTKDF